MNGSRRSGDYVRFDLQSVGLHAERVAHAVVAVYRVAARDDVQYLPVVRDGDGPGGIQGSLDVSRLDPAFPSVDGYHPPAVDGRDVAARQPNVGALDGVARDTLCLFDRGGDGLGRLLHIDHHTLANAAGRGNSHADNTQVTRLVNLADQGTDFGSADIYADDGAFHALPPPCVVSPAVVAPIMRGNLQYTTISSI
jgi:hypothetical protein